MVIKIDIPIQDTGHFESGYCFTEVEDTLILQGDPVLGATKLKSIVFSQEGEGLLTKFLRYSVDSLNWSEWIDLSECDLGSIAVDPYHFFSFEIKLVKINGLSVTFKSVEIIFDYGVPNEPSFYKDFPLSKFVPYYNYSSIEWSLNVLEKIYRQGIVPKYIERSSNENWEDRDYIDFWFPIIYYLSLNLTFNKIFKNLVWYPTLLYEYLRQKGLYLGSSIRLAELFYLMENYYSEIMKRGSLSCLVDRFDSNTGVTLRSELSRLIDKKDFDEFLMVIISSSESGWVVGETCCGFAETDFYKGFIKGFEDTEEVRDLLKYPLADPSKFLIVDGKLTSISNPLIIGSKEEVIEPLISVNPYNSYEVSFKFKVIGENEDTLRIGVSAGCKGLDSLKIFIENAFGANNGTVKAYPMNCRNGVTYYVKFCLYGLDEDVSIFDSDSVNSYLVNYNGSRFNSSSVKFISPWIQLSSNNPSDKVYIWDIKIRLLDKRNIFVGNRTETVMFLKNNNLEMTNETISKIIKEYLLPLNFNIDFRYE